MRGFSSTVQCCIAVDYAIDIPENISHRLNDILYIPNYFRFHIILSHTYYSIFMSFFVFGVNHNSAPVEIRERIAVNPDRLRYTLASLVKHDGINEAVILSTCNRTEVYCYLEQKTAVDPRHWLYQYFDLPKDDFQPFIFSFSDSDAVRHLCRVACGLDSMVLGEPQILGQLKEAYRIAHETETVGKMLNKLLQHSFSVAKRVRTDTAIGSSPVSVAFAAVRLAKQVFGELDNKTALLIGAGDTIELVAQHLHDNKLGRLIVVNRSLERARSLASRFNGFALPLKELPEHLAEADLLISSTASQLPILGKGAVEKALKKRKHRPVFMVDIAVPRDIEPEIGDLDDIYLYTVDDLQTVIEENRRSRQSAALQADEIILTETRHFMDWMQSLDAISTIQLLRNNLHLTQMSLVEKAKKHLARGEEPDQVVEALARAMIQKITHTPSVKLREVDQERQGELIRAMEELFELDPLSSKLQSDKDH